MNKRTNCFKAFCASLLLFLTGGGRASADERPPNIIFILADDLGKEWISCYGGDDDIETPHIDALAATGMRFENFYAMPQCTPTRLALLTGKFPWHNGWVNHWDVPAWGIAHFDWRLDPNTTVFRLLQDLGYVTAVSGKWQINDFRIEPDAMNRHGFDEFFMWTGMESGNPPSGARYYSPYIHTRDGSKTYNGAFGPDLYSGFLLDFIRKNKDRPFCVYYSMTLPHIPFTYTPDFTEADHPGATDMDKHRAMVRYMDKLVGRFVTVLEEEGLRQNTILIFTTDNGTHGPVVGTRFGYPQPGGKQTLWERGTAMPFIANGPGLVPSNVVSMALADMTDLLPTFVDLAGGTVPVGLAVDGVSIAPVLLGASTNTPREWIVSLGGFAATNRNGTVENVHAYAQRAIRDKRFKVRVSTDRAITHLFDMDFDPWELTNRVSSVVALHTNAKAKFQAIIENEIPHTDNNPLYTPWNLDSDGDGIPDVWETGTGIYNGPRDTGTSPFLADTDGDGWTDLEEILMGTDPNNPNFFPLSENMTEIRLPMQHFVVVSRDGTATNPLTAVGASGFPGTVTTNDMFVRQRLPGSAEQYRSRLFVRFDLSSVTNHITSARLELHQYDRSASETAHSPIELSRVTSNWNLSGTNYPLYAAGVADSRVIATNDIFGTTQTASGVYTSQVSDIVSAWLDGSVPNHGFRIALTNEENVRTAFSRVDNPLTEELDESPALVLTTYVRDLDGDGLDDAWEVYHFGSVTNSAGGLDDFDKNGIPDSDEFIAGTNPANPDSGFGLSTLQIKGGLLRVYFSSAWDRRYSLYGATNLVSGTWTPVATNLRTTPPLNEYTLFSTNAPPFLRVRIVQD